MRKILFFFLAFLLFSAAIASAEWQKPQVNVTNTLRRLLREDESIYIQRASVDFLYNTGNGLFSKVKLSPFIELRNNLNRSNKLEHKESGIEIGADFVPWCYGGLSFQYTRYNYDWTNYIWHSRIKYAAEAEGILKFTLPVMELAEDKEIEAYLSDEFLYSFKLSEGTRNEVVLGLNVPLIKYLEANIDWRHIDRIHDFDSDAVEAGLILSF